MSAVFGAITAMAREVVSFKSSQKGEEEEEKINNNNNNNNNNKLETKCNVQIEKPRDETIEHEEISKDSVCVPTKLESEKALNPKQKIDKDKDDGSLEKWKEQVLEKVDLPIVGERKEVEVKILSLTIKRHGKEDLVLPFPFTNSKTSLFALKQGNRYSHKFTFTVSEKAVSGLKYLNCVWKSGVRVDNSKTILGNFSPRPEAYTYETKEEITPTIIFARGSYCVRTKFVDDDGKCYLDVTYYFDIAKNWPTLS